MLHDACNACATAAECTAADRLSRRTSILTAAAAEKRQRRLFRRRSSVVAFINRRRRRSRPTPHAPVKPPLQTENGFPAIPLYTCSVSRRRTVRAARAQSPLVPPLGTHRVCEVCNGLGRGFFSCFNHSCVKRSFVCSGFILETKLWGGGRVVNPDGVNATF